MQQKRKVHNVVETSKRQPVWLIPVLDLIRLQVLTVIESEPVGEIAARLNYFVQIVLFFYVNIFKKLWFSNQIK